MEELVNALLNTPQGGFVLAQVDPLDNSIHGFFNTETQEWVSDYSGATLQSHSDWLKTLARAGKEKPTHQGKYRFESVHELHAVTYI